MSQTKGIYIPHSNLSGSQKILKIAQILFNDFFVTISRKISLNVLKQLKLQIFREIKHMYF